MPDWHSILYIAMPAKYKSVWLWRLRLPLWVVCALPIKEKSVPIRVPGETAIFRAADKAGGDQFIDSAAQSRTFDAIPPGGGQRELKITLPVRFDAHRQVNQPCCVREFLKRGRLQQVGRYLHERQTLPGGRFPALWAGCPKWQVNPLSRPAHCRPPKPPKSRAAPPDAPKPPPQAAGPGGCSAPGPS